MEKKIIDGRAMTTRENAHAELARALDFPSWYGAGLDALWDLVSTMDADAELVNAGVMLNALGKYGCKLLSTLYEAAEENPGFLFRISEPEAEEC